MKKKNPSTAYTTSAEPVHYSQSQAARSDNGPKTSKSLFLPIWVFVGTNYIKMVNKVDCYVKNIIFY